MNFLSRNCQMALQNYDSFRCPMPCCMLNFYRHGSVVAIVQLLFQKDVNDQLKPLRDDVADEKLGPFTIEKQLEANPCMSRCKPVTHNTAKVNNCSMLPSLRTKMMIPDDDHNDPFFRTFLINKKKA